jgi:hypothetical protein
MPPMLVSNQFELTVCVSSVAGDHAVNIRITGCRT